MTRIYESDVEELVIDTLDSHGYVYLSPEEQEEERDGLEEVVLKGRMKDAIDRLNPDVPAEVREDALKKVLDFSTQSLEENNEAFHKMFTDGVEVEYQQDGQTRGDKVWLVDFQSCTNNDLVVANQFTVVHENITKRPDVVMFVNGLPLVVIELKNPTDEAATVRKAFTQLQNYKAAIPQLFYFNALLVASDGLDAKAGSLTADWPRFMAWKTVEGEREADINIPQMLTMILGMLTPSVLLDLIKQFTVFERTKKEDPETGVVRMELIKKVAAYHQYHAVNKAVETTLQASKEGGDHKAGVVWHTQGSGKSLSMVFYSGKIVLGLDNPTVVVITDRNDLDDQLFDTFATSRQLLRQEPVQAESRAHMKELLKTTGGGIVFTTIQKFFPEGDEKEFEELSNRSNIVVIADEAHRSQYGFAMKTIMKDGGATTRYGFAKYLRDAVPNASFIGFTGTPIETEDASTRAVFGDYIDVYDIQQAVEDGATVRIFYESRLVKVHLEPDKKELVDAEVEAITEGQESAKEKAKTKWGQLEAIVGHKKRLHVVAKDIVDHFEKRREAFDGKAMIVTMSRRIAVDLFEEIIKLRPDWHDKDKRKGVLKVVMTSSSSDPQNWQIHHTNKQERKELGERFKDPSDSLKLVIVRDMWLTGFDAPCAKTMYIDKPMRGHNLMQAIARVNRVYKDIEGGLIVDYIGIASDLKKAMIDYTESGGKGAPTLNQDEAVAAMLEKYEIVEQMFEGFDYKRFFSADTKEKMEVILEAQEHVLGLEDGKDRFVKQFGLLLKSYSISMPHPKAFAIKDEVGFFQAVKARLVKFEPQGEGKSDEEIDTAIRQIVEKAVVAEEVVDIFDAAGIKKPDISILSEDFLAEVRGMERKNIAIELLKKILSDEIRVRGKRNLLQSKKLSDMLERSIRKYQNNILSAAEVIEELIELAKEMKEADSRGENFGLTDDELAFYDALADNESAIDVLGDGKLRELAQVLVEQVRSSAVIDWTIKENAQAKLRVLVKRTLKKYGYPPDKQKVATEFVLKQAKLFADEWSEK